MPTSPHIASEGEAGTVRLPVLLALAVAGVTGSLMQTMVLPLLPQFPALMNISMSQASWIATSTILVGAFAAPLSGRLGDRLGMKRTILLSLLLLAIGAIICARSETLAGMLAGRVFQGMGVGIGSLSISLLRRLCREDRLPIAVGIVSGSVGIGTSLGVPLAGVIVWLFSWQAIFWIVAAASAGAALLVLLCVPDMPSLQKRPLNFSGALGLAVILIAVLAPLSRGGDGTVLSPASIAVIGSGIVLAPLWVMSQLRARTPFVDFTLFRLPTICASHAIALLLGFAFFVSFTATITVSQMPSGGGAGLGGSVLMTGFVQMPASISAIIAPILAGIATTRIGARRGLQIGIACALLAFGLRALDLTHPIYVAATAMLVSGGISFAFAALPIALMRATPVEATGASNGVNLLSRQLGAAFASVAGGIIISLFAQPMLADGTRQTFEWLFGLGGGACLVALVLVEFIDARPLSSHPVAEQSR